VTATDLVLPGEPVAVVLGPAGVENPLAEALAYRLQIRADRLTCCWIAEVGEQMGRAGDEAVPDIEDGSNLVRQHIMRPAQRCDVGVAEQQ
jgi:hypothetical protein